MKLTIEYLDNDEAKTRTFDLPEGTWRFIERRMSDGRCFNEVAFIHGEKEDMGELAQHLLSAERAESFVNYGEPVSTDGIKTINLRGVRKLGINTKGAETGRFSSSEPHEVRPPATEKEVLEGDNAVIKESYLRSLKVAGDHDVCVRIVNVNEPSRPLMCKVHNKPLFWDGVLGRTYCKDCPLCKEEWDDIFSLGQKRRSGGNFSPRESMLVERARKEDEARFKQTFFATE